MCAAMPRGAVIGTVPLAGPAADAANAVLREEVVKHGLRLADLGAVKSPPTRGREAIRLGDVGARGLGAHHGRRDRQPGAELRPHPARGHPAGRRERRRVLTVRSG